MSLLFTNFFFVFVGLFEYIRECCHRASTANTAQQGATDQSTTTQANRQSWREAAYRRAFIQLAAFSEAKKSKSSQQNYFYNRSQSS